MEYCIIDVAQARAHGISVMPTQRHSNDGTKVVVHANLIAAVDVFNQLKRYRHDDTEFINILNSPEWTPEEGAEVPNEDYGKVLALQILNTETKEDINSMELSDEESLQVKDFYPKWESFIGKELPKGYKVTFVRTGETESTLYKVIQTVNPVLEHQTPDLVPANYEVIDETHEGTLEDPIPYKKPMKVYKDKYYTYNKGLYICIKDSGDPLQYTPDEVIGHFFNVA